jgi:protoheme IX farnesyltransferase
VCGAAPVLIAWAAATGSLSWAAALLFGVVFFWQPPHFWALAIKYRDDYASVDVPMLPSVASPHTTALRILQYTLVLWLLTLVFSPVAHMGDIYLATALVLGAIFTAMSVTLLRTESTRSAMRLFGYSITYITLLFGSMVVDQLVRLPR